MNSLFVIFTLCHTIIFITNTTAQVIAGLEVLNEDYKYQVLLSMKDGLFAGAIIDERHVITAAHCIDGDLISKITVIAGIIFAADDSRIVRIVKERHIHPNFARRVFNSGELPENHERWSLENDIAILTLDRALPLGNRIEKIDLPTTNYLECHVCFIAGWGWTEKNIQLPSEVLRWTTMIIENLDSCNIQGIYPGIKEFCAIDPLESSSPSHGDSGSPLRCDGQLAGILSAGWSDPKVPTIFTNVYEHLDFINTIING